MSLLTARERFFFEAGLGMLRRNQLHLHPFLLPANQMNDESLRIVCSHGFGIPEFKLWRLAIKRNQTIGSRR